MGRFLFASKLLAASTAVNVAIYVVAGLAALVALFFMFLIITSMCERQRMTGDIEPAPGTLSVSAFTVLARDSPECPPIGVAFRR